mgnify:CR=1 FL=1
MQIKNKKIFLSLLFCSFFIFNLNLNAEEFNISANDAINPLTSLVDQEVFSIPMIIIMGWRGEPGKKDAIQHLKDGRIQIDLINALELQYSVVPSREKSLNEQIKDAISDSSSSSSPHILLVRRNSFDNYETKSRSSETRGSMTRRAAISKIVEFLEKDDIVAFMKMKQLELLNILEIGHSVLTHTN